MRQTRKVMLGVSGGRSSWPARAERAWVGEWRQLSGPLLATATGDGSARTTWGSWCAAWPARRGRCMGSALASLPTSFSDHPCLGRGRLSARRRISDTARRGQRRSWGRRRTVGRSARQARQPERCFADTARPRRRRRLACGPSAGGSAGRARRPRRAVRLRRCRRRAEQLVRLLSKQGQGEKAERLRRFGLNPYGSIARV